MWNASYAAVRSHLKRGAWYGEVNMNLAGKKQATPHFESLQAFWPALQVLAGDVDEGAESFAGTVGLGRRPNPTRNLLILTLTLTLPLPLTLTYRSLLRDLAEVPRP